MTVRKKRMMKVTKGRIVHQIAMRNNGSAILLQSQPNWNTIVALTSCHHQYDYNWCFTLLL